MFTFNFGYVIMYEKKNIFNFLYLVLLQSTFNIILEIVNYYSFSLHGLNLYTFIQPIIKRVENTLSDFVHYNNLLQS